MKTATFKRKYDRLEKKFCKKAKNERTIYLPNVCPDGPVDFLFVSMEPSLKKWAKTTEEGERLIKEGFRNNLFDIDNFILHYCIRHFLCQGHSYYITDLSKGAMPVEVASKGRRNRYQSWFPLFKEEFDIVSNRSTKVIAIGNAPYNFLKKKKFESKIDSGNILKILHYSNQAANYRKVAIEHHKSKFNSWVDQPLMKDIITDAREVLEDGGIPLPMGQYILQKLVAHGGDLTESQIQLIFTYKMTFETWKVLPPSYRKGNLSK